MNLLQRLAQQLRQTWLGMSLPRRVGFVALAVVSVAVVGGLVWWANQPDFRVLYSGLSAEDASAITAKLAEKNVKYRLSAGGSTIQVPAESVQQLRLDLAAEGLPGKSDKGFGLFDEQNLGQTPAVQHVNFIRALQAELAKTIMQIEPVAYARVHITIPEPTPFIRDQKPTTASVFLRLKPGAVLGRSHAAGIVALVARSVQGLSADQVTLVDSQGRILSEQKPADGAAAASQLEYRREVEEYLSGRAEAMLANALGPGRAMVRVTADIDFTSKKEMKQTVDPDQKILTKSMTMSQTSNGGAAGVRGIAGATSNLRPQPGAAGAGAVAGQTSKEEKSEEEYDFSRVMQTIEYGKGKVERLTVAAVVDLSAGGDAQAAAAPKLTKKDVEEIIKQAVGFKRGRDEIQVTDSKLVSGSTATDVDAEWLQMQRWQNYMAIARNASLGVAALVALVLGLLFLRRLRPAAPAAEPEREGAAEQPVLRNTLALMAQRDPDAMARILTTWLEESRQPPRAAA